MIENLVHLPSKIEVGIYTANLSCNVPFVGPESPDDSVPPAESNIAVGINDTQIDCKFDQKFLSDELKDLNIKFNETLNIAEVSDENLDVNEINLKLVNYILQNTTRDTDGRLVMPLAWNDRNYHLLSNNFQLCKQILSSTHKKLQKDPTKLAMYDAVFKEQLDMGIIEKICDVDEYLKLHPECSFMSHMGVFRMEHDSTKCRVVFLSNLCERKNGKGFSHNQVMLPGPCLNQKMITAVTLLRFDKYLITFDLRKAFLMIKLNELDQNRLLFLWYKNISKGDYSIVAYKSLRLPFGLVSSPFLLMLGLYKILIVDQTGDNKFDNIKKSIYNSMYMDNGSYTTNDLENLCYAYNCLPEIFSPYKFGLQQFYTNDSQLQSDIDSNVPDKTPENVRLFGLNWNRDKDTISPCKLKLDEQCNTKRKILSSLNEVYDIFHVYAPMLLRAKLFMQQLQLNDKLSWDSVLPDELQREWLNIARQANSTPIIHLNRSVGRRDGNYSLVGFTDASSDAYGCVLYMKDNATNEINFILSKNKVLSSEMKKKTMPALELQAIEFGVQTLMDMYVNLTGDTVVLPINISSLHIFTDNTACLHWLESYNIKFDKMQKLSVFVNNRLNNIAELCKTKPISFRHVSGETNPADSVSRPFSFRVLQKTKFYSGPEFLKSPLTEMSIDTVVNIPNPVLRRNDNDGSWKGDLPEVQAHMASTTTARGSQEHLIPVDKYSNFTFTVKVYRWVLIFVDKLKIKIFKRKGLQVENSFDENYYQNAYNMIIKSEQKVCFPELLEYFYSKQRANKNIPDLVLKLNLYMDNFGIIRVKAKLPDGFTINPMLLSKDSALTKIIIRNIHEGLSHSGIYPVLRELRKKFWICSYFSTVKNVLKKCIVCKRLNEPAIKVNQNCYRDFRIAPNDRPYSNVFLDYAGPFIVTLKGERIKIWILIITCMFTRNINIKICRSANLNDFMKALQLHIFDHGIFEFCLSDLGSQIQAGANLISTFLDDVETKSYFETNNMKVIKFQHYCKGNSSLGSLIEVCVKMTKRLLYKAIRNVILDYFEFDFIVSKTIDLLNKRPIAFKESLRSLPQDCLPFCITPEILIKGYETVTMNIIPQIQSDGNEDDPSFNPESSSLFDSYQRLLNVKSKLLEVYHSEFLSTLIEQAIDKGDRYKPVNHKIIRPGDIVLLVEKHLKRYHYPMARVQRVETNSLGEVTAAYIYKGSTREIVYRHVTSLILLISSEGLSFSTNPPESSGASSTSSANSSARSVTNPNDVHSANDNDVHSANDNDVGRRQPSRAAAVKCKQKLKQQAEYSM